MSYHGIGLGLGGAPSLRFGPHVPVGFSAQTLAHITRVNAAGGTVDDPDYLDSIIRRVSDNGVWGNLRKLVGRKLGELKRHHAAVDYLARAFDASAAQTDFLQTEEAEQPVIAADEWTFNGASHLTLAADSVTAGNFTTIWYGKLTALEITTGAIYGLATADYWSGRTATRHTLNIDTGGASNLDFDAPTIVQGALQTHALRRLETVTTSIVDGVNSSNQRIYAGNRSYRYMMRRSGTERTPGATRVFLDFDVYLTDAQIESIREVI